MEITKGGTKVHGSVRPQANLLESGRTVARLSVTHFGSKADLWIESNSQVDIVLNHYLQGMLKILDCGGTVMWRRSNQGAKGDIRMSGAIKY
ncbi:MAG: hypothetical protein WCT22_03095 [Patescibacteria group bacterium]